MSERITEELVLDELKSLGYAIYPNSVGGGGNAPLVELQKSNNPVIQECLKVASKKGTGNQGSPEFIITHRDYPEFVGIVECKASVEYHESKTGDKYGEYAVDGVKWYSQHLAKKFDVLSIAVSGQSKDELKVSHFFQAKNIPTLNSAFSDKLLGFDSYAIEHKEARFREDFHNLLKYTKTLNDTFQNKKIEAYNRALLFSGILLAFEDNFFRETYKKKTDVYDLADFLISTIKNKIEKANVDKTKKDLIESSYVFIKNSTDLVDKGYLLLLVNEIANKVSTFIKSNRYVDIISGTYAEFLKYANADKGLGIVLTPKHITELFCDLADINKDSVVFDNCCGTGGFLVSAFDRMIKDAKKDKDAEEKIKQQVIGIESKSDKYVLACSNMIIHGDGKSNIFQGDCFEKIEEVKKYKFKPTVGLLNPPYSEEHLKFILNNLEAVERGGIVVAIVQMSSALAQDGVILAKKKQLLEKHTLRAVMSMPNDLFYGEEASVVPCIMVFEAHKPHKNHKTYFGYWKDDGFIKKKNLGRIDGGKWEKIKEQWLDSYKYNQVIQGLSLLKEVKAEDEWCYEAYVKTDYSNLTEDDFIKTIKNYVAFKFHQDKVE